MSGRLRPGVPVALGVPAPPGPGRAPFPSPSRGEYNGAMPDAREQTLHGPPSKPAPLDSVKG